MIYQPAEDSLLLKRYVIRYSKDKSVLDVGTGSGIQALAAQSSGASAVLAVDIDEEAINHINKLGIKCIKSNLFSKINKEQKFDLIIFNPPYLPEDRREDKESRKATTGGKKGDELIIKFLKQAIKHLNPDGSILLILSSLTPLDKIDKLLSELNFSYKSLAKENLFMETLEVRKIQRV